MACLKRNTLICLLVSGIVLPCQGQSMIKTMLEQLAALRGYIETAQKGYRIAEAGIDTIRSIRKGEFGLHQQFFTSLRTVNPVVKQLPLTTDIKTLEERLTRSVQDVLIRWKKSGGLSPAEEETIRSIQSNIAAKKEDDLHAFDAILLNDHLAMEDGDRIRLLTELHNRVMERWRSIQVFIAETDLLLASRQRTKANNNLIIQLHQQ